MRFVDSDVQELSKESFFIQVEDNLLDLAIEVRNYINANRSKLSRNQYTSAIRILSSISRASSFSRSIINSIRPKKPVDGIDLLDEDIPF